MNGLTIFSHSVRQVLGNLGIALRTSIGVFLALIAAGFIFGLLFALSGSPVLGFFLGIGLLVFIIWGVSLIAVVWHRFILLEERPSGFIPTRPELRIWSYFWYGVAIALIVLAVFLVLFFVARLFVDSEVILAAFDPEQVSLAPRDIALRFIVGIISSVIYLRLALMLPAVALNERFSLVESWQETKPFFGAVIVVSLALSLLNGVVMFGLGMALFFVAGSGALIFVVSVLILAFNWFYFMLNISILSTLYGHIVQKREVY